MTIEKTTLTIKSKRTEKEDLEESVKRNRGNKKRSLGYHHQYRGDPEIA